MSKTTNIAEQLLKAAKGSGQTAYALAKGSGIDRSVMVRYLNGERGLNMATAAKLAEYLGLELRPIQRKGR